MPKKTAKVGLVSLKQMPDGSWQCRWWEAATRKYVRRKLPATSYAEAVVMAKVFNHDLAGGKGFIPTMRGSAGQSVRDAISEAIKNTDSRQRTRREYTQSANAFLKWLGGHRRGITRWEQVTPKTIEDFLEHCEGLGLSYDTIRRRFHVIRATGIYMARVYGDRYRNPASGVKLKRAKITAPVDQERIVLNLSEVKRLASYAKEKRADLAPIVALQAFAGLRILEAVHLRRQDVDLEAKTIRVTITPDHSPKTRASERVIPICGELVEVLRGVIEGRKIILPEPGDYLFTSRYGGAWTLSGITHALKDFYRAASVHCQCPRMAKAFPRRLRASFINVIRDGRADHRILQRYVGHELGDVLGTSYERTGLDQLRAEIVTRMEEALARPESNGDGSTETGAMDARSGSVEKVERTGSDLH